jgi:hypothetical protein
MHTHIKVLGILHIVFGFCGVLIGLFVLLFFGGLAGLIGMTDNSEGAFVAIPILGTIGLIVAVAAFLLSLPGLIAGFGLLARKPWARTLTIVLSALELLHVPFGTALGIYGLWVLLSTGSEQLFQPARVA